MAKQFFTKGDDLYLNCDMTEEEARKHMNIPDSTKVLLVNMEPITDTLKKGDHFETVLIHFNMKDFGIFGLKYLDIMETVCKQVKVSRDIIAWIVNDSQDKVMDMCRTPKVGFLAFLEKMRILREPDFLEAKRLGLDREYIRKQLRKETELEKDCRKKMQGSFKGFCKDRDGGKNDS